jgi:hypothetical protein
MRGYSLILLAIGALAFAGWIAMTDGLIDRNGKPLGTDFSNGWEKIQSIFSAARNRGANVPTAYALQSALALMLLALYGSVLRRAVRDQIVASDKQPIAQA